MEPEFALRMEHLRVHNPFAHFVASMEPEFALRMERCVKRKRRG